MTKETKEITIYDRLSRIQKQLKAPKEVNKGVSYKSRSAEQILEAAKEHLVDGEYILLNDEIINVGSRYYVKATATFGFGEKSISCTGWANEEAGSSPIKGAQLTGACSSYARKYALGGLTALDDSRDDPDKQPDQPEKPALKAEKPEKKVDETPLTPEQKEKVQAIFSAVKDALNEKTLNSIEALHKDFIATLPEDKAEWLRGQIMIKRAHFITLNAG